jgi:hypothetical protein
VVWLPQESIRIPALTFLINRETQLKGGKVKSVHEAKADFKIEFEDGSSAKLCLADPGSSVAVRDKSNAVEYLG